MAIKNLSASCPISSPEHLFGREKELERIHHALAMKGRQIFIYGDRGVGKTSLARTAAYRYQSSEAEPIVTSCNQESTFESVLQDILSKLRYGTPYEVKRVKKEKEVQIEERLIPTVKDANTAALLLRYEAPRHSRKPIVVIDEFDLIGCRQERGKFADFLKQLGDQEVPVKFIVCGMANSLHDLLDAHASAYRYLDGIKMDK